MVLLLRTLSSSKHKNLRNSNCKYVSQTHSEEISLSFDVAIVFVVGFLRNFHKDINWDLDEELESSHFHEKKRRKEVWVL